MHCPTANRAPPSVCPHRGPVRSSGFLKKRGERSGVARIAVFDHFWSKTSLTVDGAAGPGASTPLRATPRAGWCVWARAGAGGGFPWGVEEAEAPHNRHDSLLLCINSWCVEEAEAPHSRHDSLLLCINSWGAEEAEAPHSRQDSLLS